MMDGSNIKIIGKAGRPEYMAEWEYYDFFERKKVVERTWPNTPEEVQQFRESLAKLDFNTFNKGAQFDGRKVFTAVRFYKGDEIIYDRYCPFSETEALKVLSTKIALYKQ